MLHRPIQFPLNDPADALLFDFLSLLIQPVPREGPVVLRTMCSADEPVHGTGFHKHRCSCGTTWKHDDLLPLICDTKAEFEESHTCPSCGATGVTEKYDFQ